MTLLAGFKTLLLPRTGRNDICVATVMANRSQLRTERVIGPFANTTLIRTRIDADLIVSGSARSRAQLRLGGLRQAGTSLRYPCGPTSGRRRSGSSIAHSGVFRPPNAFRRSLKLPDVAVRPFGLSGRAVRPCRSTRTWLGVTLKERPSGITGACALQGRFVRAEHTPALGCGLQDDLGQSGRRAPRRRLAGWPIFERCKANVDRQASKEEMRCMTSCQYPATAKSEKLQGLPANQPLFGLIILSI